MISDPVILAEATPAPALQAGLAHSRPCTLTRRGTVLIVTLWIVFILAGLVLVFARSMRAEAYASANQVAVIQAACVERAAEQYALALVDQQKDALLDLPETYFAAVQVGDPAGFQPSGGYFWIIRPDYGDDPLPQYGLVDESSKLNLNTASLDMLAGLPAMPDEVIPAIVDWRDDNDDITDGGAESEYYLSLPMPYYCKNSPLETVEELLLIKGASRELLYGLNANRNFGAASPTFNQTAAPSRLSRSSSPNLNRSSNQQSSFSSRGTDPAVLYGLIDYLTVYSIEPNTDASGQQRININDNNRQALSRALSDAFGAARANQISGRIGSTRNFRDVFDFYTQSGMTIDEFRQIADRLTTGTQQTLRGRINVNTAPRAVLRCLLSLDENDVSNLISRRNSANLDRANLAWVAEALGQKAVGLGNLITTRACQYTADILSVSSTGRAFKRVRVVIDSRTSPPVILYRRDLTEQGWPLDPAILASLRSQTDPFVSSPRVTGRAF